LGYEPWSGGAHGGLEPREAARTDPCFEPVAAFMRSAAIESLHRGAIAVVDAGGGLIGGVGDPRVAVQLRSAAKPFQAAAVVASGAADAFSVSDEELAVICASHAGRPEHVRVAAVLLGRLGLPPSALVCGSLEHPCSGTHAGMLLLARHLGASSEGYERVRHPVQQEVARAIRSLLMHRAGRQAPEGAGGGDPLGVPLFAGIDGCGVPVVRVNLDEAAWLYASLAAGFTPALLRVRDAMLAHPDLVAGDASLDIQAMRAAPGRLVAKGGAEGVEGLGLLAGLAPGPRMRAAVGCAVKVEDGSSRPLPAVVGLFLRAYDRADAAEGLESHHRESAQGGGERGGGRIALLVDVDDLSRRAALRGSTLGAGDDVARESLQAPGHHLLRRNAVDLTVARGDDKEVLRFLRLEWPAADEETFGRPVEWLAEPIVLVLRRRRRITAVLRGHFVGGVASADELIVGRGQRGLGAGSLMLQRFEQEAKERACTRVVLRAVEGSRAEDFYRSRGYYRESVQYSYEFGYDYVRLTRRLSAQGEGRESAAGRPEEDFE